MDHLARDVDFDLGSARQLAIGTVHGLTASRRASYFRHLIPEHKTVRPCARPHVQGLTCPGVSTFLFHLYTIRLFAPPVTRRNLHLEAVFGCWPGLVPMVSVASESFDSDDTPLEWKFRGTGFMAQVSATIVALNRMSEDVLQFLGGTD